MDYDILSALSVSELCRLVNEKIGEGWTPLGGVGVGGKLYQAMTRYAVVPQPDLGRANPYIPPQYIVEASPYTSSADNIPLSVINARMLAR